MNFRIILVGLLMGAAEVVPGVSGGTIAFVSGFYERLVNDIQRFTPGLLFSVRKAGVKRLWNILDINFLLLLFGSMLVAILIFARGVSYLLAYQPILIWSFFFGLVVASVFVVSRRLAPFNIEMVVSIFFGVMLGLVVTRIAPLEAEVTPLTLFAGGCIAVCAWILPGLSGSFILLVLGLYQSVISAIKHFEFMTLTYVALGCVVGLISFSRVLSLLLQRFHHATVSVMMGFMLGSLVKIWPWKHTTSYQIGTDGRQIPVVQEPVSPQTYLDLTGQEPMLYLALASCIAGFLLIFAMDRFALLTESRADGDVD
jgi:putative membrane protein